MTENDQIADLIRMTRYYLDRSYYRAPGRAEYYAAFTLACGFLGLSPGAGTALEAWERICDRHLKGGDGEGGRA
jgi:hypothetical protein